MEKKHREKIRSTGKTQGKHREFYLGSNVATLKNSGFCKQQIRRQYCYKLSSLAHLNPDLISDKELKNQGK